MAEENKNKRPFNKMALPDLSASIIAGIATYVALDIREGKRVVIVADNAAQVIHMRHALSAGDRNNDFGLAPTPIDKSASSHRTISLEDLLAPNNKLLIGSANILSMGLNLGNYDTMYFCHTPLDYAQAVQLMCRIMRVGSSGSRRKLRDKHWRVFYDSSRQDGDAWYRSRNAAWLTAILESHGHTYSEHLLSHD